MGDAIGTAVPLSFTALYFLPRHLCRLLGVRISAFVREAYTLPFALCIPLVGVLLVMRRWFPVHRLLPLAAELMIATAVYGLGLLWAVRTKRVYQVGELALNPELEAENTDLAESLPEQV